MGKFKFFTDKIVDKICKEKRIQDFEVFYSPIKAWIETFMMFSFLIFGCLFLIPSVFNHYELYLFLFLYLVISFLIFSKHSNSFVITSTQLIIINPNFFFKRYIEFNICDIHQVEINKNKNPLFMFFIIFNQNYLEIETQRENKKFYCAGLDIRGYEDYDNLTEKTLDDLHSSLQKKEIESKLLI
jgi:hypothetical protein